MNPVGAGLCSVTLRHLAVDEVARLAAATGLLAIEWGGDVHVRPGDADAVKRARAASEAGGATCASYGSYLLADGDGSPPMVSAVLDTAVALGTPHVRVWTPFGVEPGAPGTGAVVESLVMITAAAADRDLTIGLEFHGGTLTATAASVTALLDAVDAPNLSTYWQPPYWLPDRAPAQDAAEVTALAPRLSHVHVYEWAGAEERRPLAEGADRWRAVLAAWRAGAAPARPAPRVAFLEFVAGDDPDTLRRDAQTLHALLAESP